jgi:hypothetical protein
MTCQSIRLTFAHSMSRAAMDGITTPDIRRAGKITVMGTVLQRLECQYVVHPCSIIHIRNRISLRD